MSLSQPKFNGGRASGKRTGESLDIVTAEAGLSHPTGERDTVWTVSAPTLTDQGSGDTTSVSATVSGLRPHTLEYRVPAGTPVSGRSDAFLAATLLPAMRARVKLELEGPTSGLLRQNVRTIQDIWACWDLSFARVDMTGPSVRGPESAGGVACFFSGGVDSFYTALKHKDEISALVFVHGFDLPLANADLRASVSRALRAAATELGKPLIEVQTNVRTFSERQVPWSEYHGSALASVALLLAPMFGRVYIPASFPYSYLEPWGSHPLLDPLWRTEDLEIIHDGCEATRVEKVRSIVASETALRWLRVCWEAPGGAYNCGRCEKCLRTMVNLEIAGALDRCATFDRALDLRRVARAPAPDACALMFVADNLRACEERGDQPALVRALRDCLSRRYYRGIGVLARGDLMRRIARRARGIVRSDTMPWDYERAYAFAAQTDQ